MWPINKCACEEIEVIPLVQLFSCLFERSNYEITKDECSWWESIVWIASNAKQHICCICCPTTCHLESSRLNMKRVESHEILTTPLSTRVQPWFVKSCLSADACYLSSTPVQPRFRCWCEWALIHINQVCSWLAYLYTCTMIVQFSRAMWIFICTVQLCQHRSSIKHLCLLIRYTANWLVNIMALVSVEPQCNLAI